MRWHCLGLSILIVVICVNYIVHFGWKSNPFSKSEQKGTDWDLLIFTQQWPVTTCREWKDSNPNHKCSMPDEPGAWSIHGIWPTKLHTKGPSFCNRTWHFDQKLIQPIEKELNSSWRNIESETPTYALWAHEWTKHGTCAAVLEPFNSELKYFTKGLEWFQKFNMKTELESHKVYPSDNQTYRVIDLSNMINSHYGVTPMIECRKERDKQWLAEIRLCFDKNLNLKDCDGVMKIKARTLLLRNNYYLKIVTNCNTNAPLIYPKTTDAFYTQEVVPSVYVTLYMLVSWLQWFTI